MSAGKFHVLHAKGEWILCFSKEGEWLDSKGVEYLLNGRKIGEGFGRELMRYIMFLCWLYDGMWYAAFVFVV